MMHVHPGLFVNGKSIYTVPLHTPTAADFTFTVQSLLVVWSQHPPVVMQMPSAHRPSEQRAMKAVLLLQPLSTDSACQLLQHTPLWRNARTLEAKSSKHCLIQGRIWVEQKMLSPLWCRLSWLVLPLQPLQLCVLLLQVGGGGGRAWEQRAYCVL